jgi:Skp family chaperone for outer membrane proteins
MKKTLTLLTLALFSTSTACFAADSTNANTIAVVDIQKVMQESTAAKDIRDQIKVQGDKFQADVSKKEDELRTADQKLNEQKAILSQQAFNEKREEFKNKANKAQHDVQEKRAQLDASFNESIGQVQKAISEIIADMAKEKGFQIAIQRMQILYSADSLDITDEVLKRLNAKLATVKVKTDVAPAKSADTKADSKKAKSDTTEKAK